MARRRRHHRTIERIEKQKVSKQKKYTHFWLIALGLVFFAYLKGLIIGYLIAKN